MLWLQPTNRFMSLGYGSLWYGPLCVLVVCLCSDLAGFRIWVRYVPHSTASDLRLLFLKMFEKTSHDLSPAILQYTDWRGKEGWIYREAYSSLCTSQTQGLSHTDKVLKGNSNRKDHLEKMVSTLSVKNNQVENVSSILKLDDQLSSVCICKHKFAV